MTDIRKRLLKELIDEVEERFDGNKTKAAIALQMNRVQFTNLLNGREGATIDNLMEIGAKLGWTIDVSIERKTGEEK